MTAIGIHAHPTKKLGKAPARHDVRTAHMTDFISKALLPGAPPARDWNATVHDSQLGMMQNDRFGDCGFAAQGHAVQTWTANNAGMFTPTDSDVLAAYSGCTGFQAADPSTDNGVVMLDALNYWRNVGIGGHKIGAYLKVNHHDVMHVQIAINLFGGLYAGKALPIFAQRSAPRWIGPFGSFSSDQVPSSWGGHAEWTPAYDYLGPTGITWGERQPEDWQFWLDYTDEAYAIVSLDWVDDAKPAPNGLDIVRLREYLAAI